MWGVRQEWAAVPVRDLRRTGCSRARTTGTERKQRESVVDKRSGNVWILVKSERAHAE
jgi:hypothetical protein